MLVLFTNSKSHTGFLLVQKSVTLNGVMTADPRYSVVAELLVRYIMTYLVSTRLPLTLNSL